MSDQLARHGQASIALDLVLFTFVRKRIPWSDFRHLADSVADRVPGGQDKATSLILTAAIRVARRSGHETSVVHCLTYMAHLVDQRLLRTWPTGALRNRHIQRRAAELADMLTAQEQNAVAEAIQVNGYGKAAISWWTSTNSSVLQRRLVWRG
jgi:hypothetical protein